MKSIPAESKILYDAALVKKGVPLPAHFYYRKWLKYYLDFCLKYHHEKSKKDSLPHFLQKLKDKNQTEEQRKQALHAVSIIYEVKNTDYDKIRVLTTTPKRGGLMMTLKGSFSEYFSPRRRKERWVYFFIVFLWEEGKQ